MGFSETNTDETKSRSSSSTRDVVLWKRGDKAGVMHSSCTGAGLCGLCRLLLRCEVSDMRVVGAEDIDKIGTVHLATTVCQYIEIQVSCMQGWLMHS